MSDKKTPMTRFLHDESRRAKDRLSKARKRDEEVRKSDHLRGIIGEMAQRLGPNQRDIVDSILSIVKERDELLKYRDYYEEAHYYLRRAGFDYPSGVEDKPTVLDMVESALNHRSQIQGHCHAALRHLGVSEKWITKIYSGHMQEFFDAHPIARPKADWPDATEPLCGEPGCENPGCQPVEPENPDRITLHIVHDHRTMVYKLDARATSPVVIDLGGTVHDWLHRSRTKEEGKPAATPEQILETIKQLNPKAEWHDAVPMPASAMPPIEQITAEQALQDMRSSVKIVRGKLADALDLDNDADWTNIVGATRVMARDIEHWKMQHEKASIDNKAASKLLLEKESAIRGLEAERAKAKSEHESIMMALKVVRDIIIKVDKRIQEALGREPTQNAEYASDLEDSVGMLLNEYKTDKEAWDTERGALKAVIKRMNEEVATHRSADESLASEWKRHFWNLAALLDTPRSLMGQATLPNVDQITKYVTQTINPLRKLAERVEKVEKRLGPTAKELVEERENMDPYRLPSGAWVCCGKQLPAEAQFCPDCAKEAPGMVLKPPPKIILVSCKCGTKYEVGYGTNPDDIPKLCPCCGGKGGYGGGLKQPQTEEESVFADPKFAMRNKAPEGS